MQKDYSLTIIISVSVFLIIGLSAYLFLTFSKINTNTTTTNTAPRPVEDIITNVPIHELLGFVVGIDKDMATVLSYNHATSQVFIFNSSTQFHSNIISPPYNEVPSNSVISISAPDIHPGDLVDIVTDDDLNTVYPNPATTKNVLLVKQLSHYSMGKITQIDLPNKQITIDRKDDTISKAGVIIPLSNISHLLFGYANEPPRYDQSITIDSLKVGQDVLVYSESAISPEAGTINASYLKASEPSRSGGL